MGMTSKELANLLARGRDAAFERVRDTERGISNRADAIATAIEAKWVVQSHLTGELDDDTFAWYLSQDEALRATATNLVQQILQPTPVETIPTMTGNRWINLEAGATAFWAEMSKRVPIEIADASRMENIIQNVTNGLDASMDPDTRKLFLSEAGLSSEHVKDLVPLSDYILYEDAQKEVLRAELADELGLGDGHELTEGEELLFDGILEDRVAGSKMNAMVGETHAPTYEETYGMSAADLAALFGDEDADVLDEGANVPIDDDAWAATLEDAGAYAAYDDMLCATIEDNMATLQELEACERADLSLDEADLDFADAEEIAR